MKRIIPNLRVGQSIKARIQECISENDFIVSVDGDLIRVSNGTQQKLSTGQIVHLKVSALKPLRFQLITGYNPATGRYEAVV